MMPRTASPRILGLAAIAALYLPGAPAAADATARWDPAGAALPVTTPPARLAPSSRTVSGEARIKDCLFAASEGYRIPALLIVVLLRVEGGHLGAVTRNTNDTVDIGPMQVNTIWVPKIAGHWHTTPAAAYAALRDDFCANIEGGSWILRQALDEARDFWTGVAIYHSHSPAHQSTYLRQVLARTLELTRSATPVPPGPPRPTSSAAPWSAATPIAPAPDPTPAAFWWPTHPEG